MPKLTLCVCFCVFSFLRRGGGCGKVQAVTGSLEYRESLTKMTYAA